MSDSLDRFGGTKSKLCNPGPATSKPSPFPTAINVGDPIPEVNCIVHTQIGVQDADQVLITFPNLGVDDYSVEMWFKFLPDDGVDVDLYRDEAIPVGWNGMLCGWPRSGNYFGITMSGTQIGVAFGTDTNPPGNTYVATVARTRISDMEWHHLVGTFDRSGLATFYVDGVAMITIDISAEVITDLTTTPLRYVGNNSIQNTPLTGTSYVGLTSMAAFHRTVLTAAQIRSAWIGRTINLLATTEAAYVFAESYRESDRVWDGVTSPATPASGDVYWTEGDFAMDLWGGPIYRLFMYNSTRWYVLDQSGNGRHMAMNSATWNKWFTFDPTWDKG